jgi:hypothetical protein
VPVRVRPRDSNLRPSGYEPETFSPAKGKGKVFATLTLHRIKVVIVGLGLVEPATPGVTGFNPEPFQPGTLARYNIK